jgi:hypothetical protein
MVVFLFEFHGAQRLAFNRKSQCGSWVENIKYTGVVENKINVGTILS